MGCSSSKAASVREPGPEATQAQKRPKAAGKRDHSVDTEPVELAVSARELGLRGGSLRHVKRIRGRYRLNSFYMAQPTVRAKSAKSIFFDVYCDTFRWTTNSDYTRNSRLPG